MRMRATCLWAPLAVALACGPKLPMTSDSGGTTSTTTGPGLTTTTGPSPTTSTSSTTGATEAPTSTGVGFIVPLDGGNCNLVAGDPELRCFPCDFYQPDCGPGYKCSPFSSSPDDVWDHQKCVPVVRDPDLVGEPCTVEGSPASGVDTCDLGAVCWKVDPDTLAGVCVATCAGSFYEPICAPGHACHVANEGVINFCLPTCDPLLQDCEGGETCIPAGSGSDAPQGFVCRPAGDPPAPLFASCQPPVACEPGLLCTYSNDPPACDPMENGCCLPYCDITMPVCPPDLQCLPWYEDKDAPAGLEDVGLCGVMP